MKLLDHYGVVVVGGGCAGVPAAVQAARLGARTLLVERGSMLGGTLTVAGVHYPGLFHAHGRQVIAGIGWDLVVKAVREAGGELPDFSKAVPSHWLHQPNVPAAPFAMVCDEEVVASGAHLLFHAMPAACKPRGPGGWTLTLCTKTGLREVSCSVLVDATADANVCALAGAALRLPDEVQPSTLLVRLGGYDAAGIDLPAIDGAFRREVAAGRLGATDGGWNASEPTVGPMLRGYGGNNMHIHGISGRTSEDRTDLEILGRRAIRRLVAFLRTQPGLGNLRVETMQPEIGVRETATVVGRETVTVHHVTSGYLWPDAVCHSFYPIDLHRSDADGLDCRPLAPGVVPTVPRGALLPVVVDRLVVAGRCLSSDRLAHSALRVQATAMATGQAAGAMAALACREGIPMADIPLALLHETLRKHGAIVPDMAAGVDSAGSPASPIS